MKSIISILTIVILFSVYSLHASTVVVDNLYADEVFVSEISALNPETAMIYYAFEENVGTVAADSTTNAHDGVISGCVWSSDGKYNGGSMTFSGNSSKISVTSAPNFPQWAKYSVSDWFLNNGGGDFGNGYGHKIIDKTSMMHDWYIMLYPTGGSPGHIAFSSYESSTSRGMGNSDKNYMDNMWHHVVVVKDGTNGYFWVDGELKRTRNDMITVNSSSKLCIGNSNSTDGYQRKGWSGKLDEVRIYDYALSCT